MDKSIAAAFVLGSFLLIPGFAGAVHGSPYTANGIAFAPDGSIYNVRVQWTGYWSPDPSLPYSSFIVTLTTLTGAPVSSDVFPGQEWWNGPIVANNEIFGYHGWAQVQAGGSPHFDITGTQIINISTGLLYMEYVGNWYDYRLELIVN
jgi:hypothetical protein